MGIYIIGTGGVACSGFACALYNAMPKARTRGGCCGNGKRGVKRLCQYQARRGGFGERLARPRHHEHQLIAARLR